MEQLIDQRNNTFIDAETKVILNGIPFLGPLEQSAAAAYARDRIQACIAGVSRTPQHVNSFIRLVTGDHELRIRWCFDYGTWILERWQAEGYWLLVTVLLNTQGQTPTLSDNYLAKLARLLRETDLQHHDPEEYIRGKRRAAALVKEENRSKGAQMLMAAVDAMSTKQINNFIDVHRAFHTGEKIVAHGQDEKSITMMHEASKQNAASVPINKAMNPGMNPRKYVRKSNPGRKA